MSIRVDQFARLREATRCDAGEIPSGTVLRIARWGPRRLRLTAVRPLPMCDGPVIVSVLPSQVELITERHCRECGCTGADCRGCVEATGAPCHWVESDLCSACVKE